MFEVVAPQKRFAVQTRVDRNYFAMYPMLPLEPASAMQCIAALFAMFSALLSLYFCRV
jgi:hypothetical protein